jgi:hypothetical protein
MSAAPPLQPTPNNATATQMSQAAKADQSFFPATQLTKDE